jgi:quercetin dioxygenase-like cupin family protein
MQTILETKEKISRFIPDLDQLEALGTQIQWKDIRNAEAGTVLLLAETDGPPIHYHPKQQEEFFVREGELMVFKKDQWVTLKAGDRLIIPAKTPHTYKNASEETVIFDFYITPRVRFRKMLEEMDVLVQKKKIRGNDFRSITYLCRVMASYPDVTKSVKPPQFVVLVMAFLNKLLFSR